TRWWRRCCTWPPPSCTHGRPRSFMAAVRFLVICSSFLTLAACSRAPVVSTRSSNEPVTLTIGYPLITGQDPLNGIQQAIRLINVEGLVALSHDGHPQPRLAQGWTVSPDGRALTIRLRR